jgi:hypothetical protein
MKHTWKAAVAVVALAASAGVAKADLTLDGQTGLFINPTAEVAAKSNAEIQANYQRFSAYGTHFTTYDIGGAVGVADKLELSGNYGRVSVEGYHDNSWRVGAKYQLLQQADKGFDLAVGGNYGNEGFIEGDLDHYNVYVAGTKAFNTSSNRAPIKGTLGLRWDRYSAYGDSTSKFSVYAGADVPLNRTGEFSLVGEVGSKTIDEAETPYAIGLRYHPNKSGFSIGAGFGRPNLLNSVYGGTTWFAQIGYAFGK